MSAANHRHRYEIEYVVKYGASGIGGIYGHKIGDQHDNGQAQRQAADKTKLHQ